MTSDRFIHVFNGNLVPESQIQISPRDLGFLRGFGVFDFLITYQNHKPFHLKDHIQRLFNSAKQIELDIPWSQSEVVDWVHWGLSANECNEELNIRILVTGGVSAGGLFPQGSPTLLIFFDFAKPFADSLYKNGACAITKKFRRQFPLAKTTDYLQLMQHAKTFQDNHIAELIYFDDNQVYEGATSNVYALMDGVFYTPKTGVLAGITRKVLLEELTLESPVVLKDFSKKDLLSASEVFVSASNKEVMPICKIDDQIIGTGEVGLATKGVMKNFRAYTLSQEWVNR